MRRAVRAITGMFGAAVAADGLVGYSREHLRRARPRALLIFGGSLAYAFILTWWEAVIVVLTLGVMDTIENRAARRILSRPPADEELPRLRRETAVRALLYALSGCLAVALCWGHASNPDGGNSARILALIIAILLFFDAAFQFSSCPRLSLMKSILHVANVAWLVFASTVLTSTNSITVLDAFVLVMLVGGIGALADDLNRHRQESVRNAADLAERGEILQRVVAQLTEKERAVRRLALAAEHASDSIIITDAEQRIEWVNAGFTAATGLTLADVAGRSRRSVVAPPDPDLALAAQIDEAVGAQRAIRVQARLVRRGGRLVWHDMSLTPIFDGAGVLTHWVAVEHDISELKAREAELARSQAEASRLALVAEHARDAVVIYAPDGRIEWVNPAFTTQSGYAFAEAAGRPVGTLMGAEADPGTLEAVREAMAEEHPARAEVRLLRKDGTSFWCEASLSPVHSPDGRLMHYVSVERDISELKAREAELGKARRAAEAAAEAKSSFLATMSHEIRTPMNGIIGTADLLAETPLDDDQSRLVRTIASSSEALLRIINDILDLSKLEAGRMEIQAEPFDPADLVDLCAQLMRPLADRKGLAMEVVTGPGADAPLTGDPGRMRQILLNLLGNAIKFTESGSVTLSVDVEVAGPRSRRLRLAVGDTGIGIAPDRLEGVFDAFTQADGTITRRFGGTGLGLSISRRLAEAMGGEMAATSGIGEGSEFSLTLELPLAETAPPAMTVIEGRGPTETTPAAGALSLVADAQDGPVDGPFVLVVEDNATNRFLVERMLVALGCHCAHAGDGAEGVEACARLDPDLVVMDVSMPVMDGFEATRRIREAEVLSGRAPRPILALTANAHEGDRERGAEAGVTRFLTKPIRKAELCAAISEALAPPDAGGVADLRAAP